MIWFAIIWLAVGSVAAILFGLMAHRSQVALERSDSLIDADTVTHKDHIPAH